MLQKIFFIGFGKNGTTSFYIYFRNNGVVSIHNNSLLKSWLNDKLDNKFNKRADCYVYDSIFVPFDIDFILSHFSEAYYILPTRGFVNWTVSVINHFTKNNHPDFELDKINGELVYRLLAHRNNYYQRINDLIENNKFKNIKIIDIENDDVNKTLKDFLPVEYFNTKRNIEYPHQNKSNTNLTKNTEYLKVINETLKYLKVKDEDFNDSWIIKINKSNIDNNELKMIK